MESWESKLDRASEHLDALERESRDWIDGEPYVVTDETNPNPPLNKPADWFVRHRRFRLVSVDPVPEKISVLLGDCVFCARSALDHLALALARSFTPSMTDSQIAGSEFPIFDAPMDAHAERRKIGCIAHAPSTIIKAFQPYHRGDNCKLHPLWQLHQLNKIDKHRELVLCIPRPLTLYPDGSRKPCVGFVAPDNIDKIMKSMRYWRVGPMELEVNAVLMEYGLLFTGEPERDVYMQPELTLEPCFGKTSPVALEPVFPTLDAILDFVRNVVVAKLAQFL